MNFYAIIPAAGLSERFGGQKKQFVALGGKSLLERVVDVFLKVELFEKIVVCLPKGDQFVRGTPPSVEFVAGGASRAESVKNGFDHLSPVDDDVVLIHDAARPLIDAELIRKVAEETKTKKAVIPVVSISDTVKEVMDGHVLRTVDRKSLFAVQTPQGFSCALLSKVYKSNPDLGAQTTDEAMLVESLGYKVCVVEGQRTNIKVTTPEDLRLAEILITPPVTPS